MKIIKVIKIIYLSNYLMIADCAATSAGCSAIEAKRRLFRNRTNRNDHRGFGAPHRSPSGHYGILTNNW